MRQIRLGRTQETVSAIGLGTWAHGGPETAGKRPVGWSGHDDEQARLALTRAHELGINHWDTADVYGSGRAERLIGTVWQELPRSDIFLASKVGWDAGPYGHPYDPRWIRERAERSLAYLRTESIDLYYLHHCNFGPRDRYLEGAAEALGRLRSQGKIRFLGLSDWSCRKLTRIARLMDPDVIQAYRNVVDDEYESSGLQAWARQSDAGVAFFSPLKHGLLLGKYRQPTEFGDGDMRNSIPEFRDPRALDSLQQARREVEARFPTHPHPVLHALTGYLLRDEPSASVLVGQRSPGQAEAAATLGAPLGRADAEWVRSRYL